MTVNVEICIYIYVWKLNPTLLELDIWADKFCSSLDAICTHTIDTLWHQSLSLMSSALCHIHYIYIYLYKVTFNECQSVFLLLYCSINIFITKLDFTLWAISIDWYKYQHCVGIVVFNAIWFFFLYLYWYFVSFLFS